MESAPLALLLAPKVTVAPPPVVGPVTMPPAAHDGAPAPQERSEQAGSPPPPDGPPPPGGPEARASKNHFGCLEGGIICGREAAVVGQLLDCCVLQIAVDDGTEVVELFLASLVRLDSPGAL